MQLFARRLLSPLAKLSLLAPCCAWKVGSEHHSQNLLYVALLLQILASTQSSSSSPVDSLYFSFSSSSIVHSLLSSPLFLTEPFEVHWFFVYYQVQYSKIFIPSTEHIYVFLVDKVERAIISLHSVILLRFSKPYRVWLLRGRIKIFKRNSGKS